MLTMWKAEWTSQKKMFLFFILVLFILFVTFFSVEEMFLVFPKRIDTQSVQNGATDGYILFLPLDSDDMRLVIEKVDFRVRDYYSSIDLRFEKSEDSERMISGGIAGNPYGLCNAFSLELNERICVGEGVSESNDGTDRTIWLSEQLSEELHSGVGDTVTLTDPYSDESIVAEIKGVFATDGSTYPFYVSEGLYEAFGRQNYSLIVETDSPEEVLTLTNLLEQNGFSYDFDLKQIRSILLVKRMILIAFVFSLLMMVVTLDSLLRICVFKRKELYALFIVQGMKLSKFTLFFGGLMQSVILVAFIPALFLTNPITELFYSATNGWIPKLATGWGLMIKFATFFILSVFLWIICCFRSGILVRRMDLSAVLSKGDE